MAYSPNIKEEELKGRLRKDYFTNYDAEAIIGNIDFAVTSHRENPQQTELFEREWFLWAEAKRGASHSLIDSIVQLVITIGKARAHEKHFPPRYIGAFDSEKIAFIEFHYVISVFYQNDFNWNVAPSNHNTKEFKQLKALLEGTLYKNIAIFSLDKDEKALHKFIKKNFNEGRKADGLAITRNNFLFVFQRWVEEVKPTIDADWSDIPANRIVDFFYADLISSGDYTLRTDLAVVLRGDEYKILEHIMRSGKKLFSECTFTDGKKAYRAFWNKYKRPPRQEAIDIIIERRDLLIPQDLRRYQGAYFTPPQWVELSQKYLSDELGENWQDEYYIWDCCAGTGNLLYGLTNKYNIWASTLDHGDVQVMKSRVADKELNLLESHLFQFDFLNDTFTKLPEQLQKIIKNDEKRKKLVIYINPPYAESGNTKGKDAKKGVSNKTRAHHEYTEGIGSFAKREIFVQFFMRVYRELTPGVLAHFSKLKILQGPYFKQYRNIFRAKLGRNFCVPANTFDNVDGLFPIGFFIWNLDNSQVFKQTITDIYNSKAEFVEKKTILSYDDSRMLNDWLRATWKSKEKRIGYLACNGNDFLNQNSIFICSKPTNNTSTYFKPIMSSNLLMSCIYLSVRHCIEATWLNDRDQFLCPNDGWQEDVDFQGDCLAFALFFNIIQSKYGTNHWIPFTEEEVDAKDKFESHFMSDFIRGIWQEQTKEGQETRWDEEEKPEAKALRFSAEAQAVMDAGRELWKYYHAQPGANPNASFYDIRLYFQGTKTTPKGKVQMNPESNDGKYTELITTLRERLKILAQRIEPKVYEYGFLKR